MPPNPDQTPPGAPYPDLLRRLTPAQDRVVRSGARRLLVVAGAGSGKTETIARRIAWQVAVEGVPRESIVAFTFTERAAEEMQFRIRRHLGATGAGDITLGDMYVGTIHGYCLQGLRLLAPDTFHNFDVIDEGARIGLVERHWFGTLGGPSLQKAFVAAGLARGHFDTIARFLQAYDLLNEYHELRVDLPPTPPPHPGGDEEGWCAAAVLRTDVGTGAAEEAFAASAARFYALLRCRRFLDFSTAQAEFLRLLDARPDLLQKTRERTAHLVVDEVQDINPVQRALLDLLVGASGRLTAVGDHRQAIFGWRGGRVEIVGELYNELKKTPGDDVIELDENFRSTPRVIGLANAWADTINAPGGMPSADMAPGRTARIDYDPTHVGCLAFPEREDEAEWIAGTIANIVQGTDGARHDDHAGDRGLRYSDVAVLLRTGADARTYGDALDERGIPAVFRGADLFGQPEVLFFVAALARIADVSEFYGRMQRIIDDTLNCPADTDHVLVAAAASLSARGLPIADDLVERIKLLTRLLRERVTEGLNPTDEALSALRSESAVKYLRASGKPRRIFPQAIFHILLEEAEVAGWDAPTSRGVTTMFHLGALSSMVTSIEMPGWTTAGNLKFQIIALCTWGPSGRLPEADLLAAPDAVSIGTIHSAKGLEWPAVFVADVRAQRFPTSRARTQEPLPISGALANTIDPAALADNENLDQERRLMYVALTRAERYLYVTSSGKRQSRFRRELEPLVDSVGGTVPDDPASVPRAITLVPGHRDSAANRLVSSFSDLRYYLECPHDFYLRKVLGFAPSIDQTFGYGRGVHNLMRAVHSDPARWAALAGDPSALRAELRQLVADGLFYLRYTTGDPRDRMQNRGVEIVAEYVQRYAPELTQLEYEPEREFETLIEEEQILICGAIDVVRRDDPPQVTLIDFKSGEAEADIAVKLDREEMQLQISLYGIAARDEMEYETERGLVRYLGEPDPEKRELHVPLTDEALANARDTVVRTARRIKQREFHTGPAARTGTTPAERCQRCDFRAFCGVHKRAA